jgi:hypothetical protein
MGLVDFDYFLTCARDFRSERINWMLWCWRIVELYYKKDCANNRSCLNVVRCKRTLVFVSHNRKSVPLIVIWHYILFIVQTGEDIFLLLHEQISIMLANYFGEFIPHLSLNSVFTSCIIRHNIYLKIKRLSVLHFPLFFPFIWRANTLYKNAYFVGKYETWPFTVKEWTIIMNISVFWDVRLLSLVYSYGGIGLLPPPFTIWVVQEG